MSLLGIISLLFALSLILGAEVQVPDEEQILFYDSETEAEIFGRNKTNFEVKDFEVIPPPPGSDILNTRKRSQSFHKSLDEMEKTSVKEIFISPESFEYDDRNDTKKTVVEYWDLEEFIMDHGSLYPSRSRSFSNESANKAEIKSEKSDSKSAFKRTSANYNASKFNNKLTKSRSRLTSFEEAEEQSEEY